MVIICSQQNKEGNSDAPDTRLHWISTGKEQAETLLLLHAVGCDRTYWDRHVEALKHITCPTLVLVGDRDPSTPPSTASALAKAIAGAELGVIPNALHMVTLEAPVAISTEMQRFLAPHQR